MLNLFLNGGEYTTNFRIQNSFGNNIQYFPKILKVFFLRHSVDDQNNFVFWVGQYHFLQYYSQSHVSPSKNSFVEWGRMYIYEGGNFKTVLFRENKFMEFITLFYKSDFIKQINFYFITFNILFHIKGTHSVLDSRVFSEGAWAGKRLGLRMPGLFRESQSWSQYKFLKRA